MTIWSNIAEAKSGVTSSAVIVGNFDGVHVGHQAMVKDLLAVSKANNLTSVAVLFSPHPIEVLGYQPPLLITTPQERARILQQLGVEHCLIQPFTNALAQLSAKEFLQTSLIDQLKMKFLLIGPTTHLGKNREGTPLELERIAKVLGLGFGVATPLEVNGSLVSSSRVRSLIQSGDMQSARKCLGRYHFTRGHVVEGHQRGRTIGFPTANLRWDPQLAIPGRGVYSTLISVGNEVFASITNVGIRPTFESKGVLSIESHVLGIQRDFMGDEISVHWVDRIRQEQKFASAEDLKKQIEQDILVAQRQVLSPTSMIPELFLY